MSVFMLFILHKNVITKFCIFSAAAAGTTIRTAIRYISNVEHFRVGTTWTILQSPPVIFRRKVINILFLKAGVNTALCAFLITRSILITGKYSCCKMISVETIHLCQQLVTPFTTILFEVVAKRPATHHFKECNMALISYGIDIIGTNTSLYVTKSCTKRMLLPQQIRHQGLHTCYIEQYTCGTIRYQRHSSHIHMATFFIEL